MDHFFDTRAPFQADDFWLIRPQIGAQQADAPAAETSGDDARQVFARDWTDASVRLGAIRWYAREGR